VSTVGKGTQRKPRAAKQIVPFLALKNANCIPSEERRGKRYVCLEKRPGKDNRCRGQQKISRRVKE
jgi:hypothetical protein